MGGRMDGQGTATSSTATTQQTVLAADDHRHGWNADDGFTDLFNLIAYGGGWIFFTFLQMTSTEDSVFGLLQEGVTVPPKATPQQVVDALNGTMDRNHLIGFAIALSVQLFLTMLAFPTTRALLTAHRKAAASTPHSASTGQEAMAMAKWQQIVCRLLVGADVLTDFLYVINGHNVFAGSLLGVVPWINPNGGLGIIVVGLVYPLAVCGATVFFGNIAFKRLGSFFHRVRANTRTN